jgi:hypothetical protein
MKMNATLKVSFILTSLIALPAMACTCDNANQSIQKLKNKNKINVSGDCKTITFKNWTRLKSDTGISRLDVPSCLNNININSNVTVTGNFVSQTGSSRLTIKGGNRETSKIRGEHWDSNTFQRGPQTIEENTGIFAKTRELYIEKISSNYPDKYHILGRKKTVVNNVNIVTLPGDQNANPDGKWHTTDGFGGGDNSQIKNSWINVHDDAIKIYSSGNIVDNVGVRWNKNGAPLQLGWGTGDFYQFGNATISRLNVIKQGNQHNLGLISWANGAFASNKRGNRTLTFTNWNTYPSVNNIVQWGGFGKSVDYITLNLKGSHVCNNQNTYKKITGFAYTQNGVSKNSSGGHNFTRSLGCNNNFAITK